MPATRRTRRSPAEVTYDRLDAMVERYAGKLSEREKDAIAEVCRALWEIAGGERDQPERSCGKSGRGRG